MIFVPFSNRCLLASATIKLASTANPSLPTSPVARQVSTTCPPEKCRSHETAYCAHVRTQSGPGSCLRLKAHRTSDKRGSLHVAAQRPLRADGKHLADD